MDETIQKLVELAPKHDTANIGQANSITRGPMLIAGLIKKGHMV
jgi:hypothetical protein